MDTMLGTTPRTRIPLSYDTPRAALDAFAAELGRGAVFIPGDDGPAVGSKVLLVVSFPFSGGEVEIEGEVVTALTEAVRSAGGTPGVAVALCEGDAELRRRVEAQTGLELPRLRTSEDRTFGRSVRFPARTRVTLEAAGRHFQAETLDVSYNGLLALLPGVDLSEGEELRVTVEHPRGGPPLEVKGSVVNATRCDHGVMAHGIKFEYALERYEEVSLFVDELRGHQHARSLVTVAGSLAHNPLEVVIETFASVSPKGTLRLSRGEDEGRIVYEDDRILSATCGLVSGAKALGRMFRWTDAGFEFEPERAELDVADDPLPLRSALVSAAVERDELARLDLSGVDEEGSFQVDESRLAALEDHLDELARELAANAEMGFPLAALLDILPASDARIYQALAELVESGVVAPAA